MEFVLRGRVGRFEPNADVFIDNDRRQVVVKVEVAGADPARLVVEVAERGLLISGLRRDPALPMNGSFAQKEITYGEFAKLVQLPVPVSIEETTADYSDGILVIALPIAATAYIPTTRTQINLIIKRTLV